MENPPLYGTFFLPWSKNIIGPARIYESGIVMLSFLNSSLIKNPFISAKFVPKSESYSESLN